MKAVLVIEHGPFGASNDIAHAIKDCYSGCDVVVCTFISASEFIKARDWDAVIIDANGSADIAIEKAKQTPRINKYRDCIPVIFATNEIDDNIHKTIYMPWNLAKRNIKMILQHLEIVRHPVSKEDRYG